MRKPKLCLHAPTRHTLWAENGQSSSNLTGQVLVSLPWSFFSPTKCSVKVSLIRVGQLKDVTSMIHGLASKDPLEFVPLKKKSHWLKLAAAERLVEYDTPAIPSDGDLKSERQGAIIQGNFELDIPVYLPPTTKLPLADIAYALVVTYTTEAGESFGTGQEICLERPSFTVMTRASAFTYRFPQSSLAIRMSFSRPLSMPNLVIPTKLRLRGLSLISDRSSETKWMALREIRWKVEETTLILSEKSNGSPSSATGDGFKVEEQERTLCHGRQKHKATHPFTESAGSGQSHLGDAVVDESFNLEFPGQSNLASCVSSIDSAEFQDQLVLCSSLSTSEPSSTRVGRKFAIQVKQTLQVFLHVGEDSFDSTNGTLVDRKVVKNVFALKFPLDAIGTQTPSNDGVVMDIAVGETCPAYELIAESPPPYDS